MKISEQIIQLKINIEKLESNHLSRLNEIEEDLTELRNQSVVFSENWLGNWFNHSNTYRNFLNKSDEHINVEYAKLYEYVTQKANIDYESIDKEIKNIIEEFKSDKENLIVELSILKSNEQFLEQIKILDKLEDFEWGVPVFKIVDSQKPKTFMGDYNTAQKLLTKGIIAPPHITFSANLLASASQINSLKDYIKLAKRVLRETELLMNMGNDEFIGLDNPIVNLNKIFDNFHDVARLLINRHGGRETIKISDEYDVQDLLRSLLKIFFDDVRPEDYTPSFAGRNTRLDFLLKKEKIVIEVKKTRDSLKDKEIGDELLQDIARYRNHPDCNTLYCFVYDPQGHIINPRGLEEDLCSESNEKMTVYVSIRP
jgi:hypothetical protein